MNREEIVKLAKECTAPEWWDEGMERFHMGMDFIAFAAAIRAATKEEDARICDAFSRNKWALYKGSAPYKGNETGRAAPHVLGQCDGSSYCADAIRASK